MFHPDHGAEWLIMMPPPRGILWFSGAIKKRR